MTTEWIGFPGARGIDEEELRAVVAVLARQTLYRGAGLVEPTEVKQGERELAAALGRRFAVLMNSGTSALLAALVALDVRERDEVILPSYGWLTDVSVVLHRGAVPVLAPIGEDLGIDCKALRKCRTPRTRAIAIVHACGRPCDVDAVAEFADEAGIAVIEDACQAMGSSVRGTSVGRFGQVTAVSFQAFKAVTAGEGGALLTDDERIYEAAVRFHDAGLSRFAGELSAPDAMPRGVGLNLRMSELSAALVRVQLRRLAAVTDRLRRARAQLLEALHGAVIAGALRPVRELAETCDNGTFLILSAKSPPAARAFHEAWLRRGCAARLASEAKWHTSSGWVEYLHREGRPHRVVDPDATRTILGRTLILEVNWRVTNEMLEALSAGTREALQRI